jgi:two-component system, NarL family, nitrate/nitrite response regulator NarL
MPNVRTIAIIEDHPTTRKGIEAAVMLDPTLKVVVAVSNVEEFMPKRHVPLNVIILDLGLRGGILQGTAAVEAVCALGVPVLVVSMREAPAPVLDAISAGAKGYLTKEAEPEEIVRAISRVADGRTYFSATVAGYLLRDAATLTPREQEVLKLVAEGETTKRIAKMLHLAETTVNNHLDHIRRKTGSRRRADMTRFAIAQGLIDPADVARSRN